MSKMKQAKKFAKKATAFATVFGMAASLMPAMPMQVKAANFTGQLTEVKAVDVDTKDKNVVWVTFNDDVKGKITFLEDGIFRYNVDPSGEFSKYAVPNKEEHAARIQQYPDESSNYSHPAAAVTSNDSSFTVKSGDVSIVFDKGTAKMTVKEKDKTVMEEEAALTISGRSTVQTIKKQDGENFYGGGTQNGRFVHTGESLEISVTNNWTDGGVASPNPFYYTTEGYGVLRNTFQPGNYDFGKTNAQAVTAQHSENEFDAYYFVAEPGNGRAVTQEILQEFYKVTGNPVLVPEYAFYEGHLNAYNRDAWSDTSGQKRWTIKGTDSSDSAGVTTYETGMNKDFVLEDGMASESLNGEGPTVATDEYPDVTTPYKYSARAVIDDYVKYDMPLGFFLPNDGYGAGYGQNGYNMTGGVNKDGSSSAERLAAVDANVKNLEAFADYAASKGVATGLWTQSDLTPDSDSSTLWHRLRDFEKEVGAGVTTLKTDVAWVGPGYSMQLDGVKMAYDIVTDVSGVRPNIISLNGWAGSQRYNGIWTGDQYGGSWEYIRFHIPTYIGTSLSGNPNVGSDMDGIFGGSALISTRDYQWKVFTPSMLNMDGWGSYAKMPYTFGDPYTGINRMYLKLKSKLMPYLYTTAYAASNIDVGNNDTGLPMVRAMFLEYPDEEYAYSKNMQYQYMFGKSVLVAPVYQDTNADEAGNDVRDNIYLPDENAIWVDFFTGKQYRGGQILNKYDAPLWKLPVFVKNGSIIPQYEANNNPAEINKANRIVEFWPEGETDYTAVEDDGTLIENQTATDQEYGVIENVSYGDRVTTKYTSKVENQKATLTAEKSSGTYNGYTKEKNTTFIVHVSKKPESIAASNGAASLNVSEAATKDAFDEAVPAAGTAVWFYDAAPVIEDYASEKETAFKALVDDVEVAPKLYVKFAAVDAQAEGQTLVINGFENDGNLPANTLNDSLGVPVLTEDEEAKTPTSITVNWEAVEGATSYELMIDGRLNTIDSDALSYTYTDLAYSSKHTFQVRAKNAEGYSEWSKEQTFVTDEDPWRNTPDPVQIDWEGGIYSDRTVDKAFDKVFQTGDGGFHSGGSDIGKTLTVDYGKAYQFEKLEYYPRDDGGNGTVTKMRLETSLDGVHWMPAAEYDWSDTNAYPRSAMKTMEINSVARYIRLTPLASVGNFFSASELKVYKVDGSKSFAVGSTLFNEEVQDADYTNMTNYKGLSVKDSLFETQIQKGYGDINLNGYYDVYDYAYTMFQLDGGTQKSGKLVGASAAAASKEQVAAGETFTVAFQAENVENVNALGQIITYDPGKVEYVSVQGDSAILQMQDLCINKVYEDGTAYVNIAFANRGDKDLYSGSGTLVTLTMKAKEAISTSDADVLNLHGLILIAPDYSTNGEIGEEPEAIEPEIPVEPEKQYGQSDFTITITNEKLPTDDGTNVEQLINQKSFDGLFDGTKGRDFEFLWNIESNWDPETNQLPEYITLPVTMNFALNQPGTMTRLVVHNANRGNGFVTSVKAKVNYEDGTSSEEKTITLSGDELADYAAFTFEDIFVSGKNVASVDVTILNALSAGGEEVTNLLTLAEIEMFDKAETPDAKFTMDELDLAITNEKLPTDDGTNVEQLIQSGKFDGLFDGKFERDFELKWTVTDVIKMPVTLHFTPKEAASMSKLVVHNANKANGFVTSVKAVVNYEDGTSNEETITLDESGQVGYAAFTFEFDQKKAVKSLDVTMLKALDQNDNETDEMLTLAEVELFKGSSEEGPDDPDDPVIGPNDPDPENPLAPGKVYGQDAFDLTITNDEMPTDDGSNVQKLINQKSFDGLFDGSIGRDFELLWNIESNWVDGALPSYVKVPFTIHLAMENPGPVSQIIVHNANKANGYVTAISAKINYKDGSSTIERIRKLEGDDYTAYQDNSTFVLKYAEDKAVESVDVTVLRAIVGGNGTVTKNMVTLAELQVFGILDLSGLQGAYDEYKDTENPNGLYTTATWTKFQDALKKAESLLNSTDQAEADKAAKDLKNAHAALKTNREVLQDECKKQEKEQNNGTYTKESWEVFEKALGDAKKLLENESAAGSDLEKALTELQNAFDKLVKLNRTELKAEYNKYKDIVNEGNTYTDDSWAQFQKALDDAKKVLDSTDVDQAAIDRAAASLEPAYAALVAKSTVVERINGEIKKLEAVSNAANTYTAESWNVFQAALTNAKNVLADATASSTAIEKAYADLQKAYQALAPATPNNGGNDTVVDPPATEEPAPAIKNGDTVTYGKVIYKVTNASKNMVVASKLKSKNATSVTIPATVKVNGVSCKVVQISASAFKGATKLRTVVIGKNVQTIGKNAFNGCTKLKKVTFKGTNVPAIKTGAFKKTKSGITVKVPKKMTKAARNQLKKKLTGAGMSKKLKIS